MNGGLSEKPVRALGSSPSSGSAPEFAPIRSLAATDGFPTTQPAPRWRKRRQSSPAPWRARARRSEAKPAAPWAAAPMANPPRIRAPARRGAAPPTPARWPRSRVRDARDRRRRVDRNRRDRRPHAHASPARRRHVTQRPLGRQPRRARQDRAIDPRCTAPFADHVLSDLPPPSDIHPATNLNGATDLSYFSREN
jgi:hypothetical protein